MKKITLTLIAAILCTGFAFGQVMIIEEAPLNNSSTSANRAPNGTSAHAYMRACFLVLQSELANIPSSTSLTNFGFTLNSGVSSSPVSGNFTVYLQNTTDVSYSKGTTYGTAITGMTTVFANVHTIPVSATTTSVLITLSTPFTYNGGGLYVAYDWYSTGPFSSTAAIYLCESIALPLPGGGGATAASSSSAPTTLGLTNFRPSFLFGYANPYSNDMKVVGLEAPGKVAAMFNTPHTISAMIKNSSNTSLTNIPVNLNVTGANVFAATTTISSLAAGASTLISFTPFNPQLPGLNTISVSVLADQNNVNNSSTYAQSVTCNYWAQNPAAGNYTSNAVGFGAGSGILLTPYLNPVTSTITGLRFAVSTNTASIGKAIWGALLSSAGAIIATTNTITITSGMMGTFINFTFGTGQSLASGTTYYIGVGLPVGSTAYYPAGSLASAYMPPNLYSFTALTGGAFTTITQNFGYFGIEAVFNPTVSISVASQTVTCGTPATLVASSASNYSWSTGATTSSIVVSPTVTTGYSVSTTNTMGCEARATPTVVINPIPVVASAASTVICEGDVITLNASGANSFTWTTSSGPTTGSSITVSPQVTTTYSLTGDDPSGCFANALITISVNPLPFLNAISSSSAICLGNTVTLSASGAATYNWDGGATTQSFVDSPTVTTVYTATGTSAAGCSTTKTVMVVVNSFTPGITSSTAICLGTTITLNATGGTGFVWNTGLPFASLNVSPGTTTGYTVTGTGPNGCTGSAMTTVSVNPLPAVTVSATANRTLICKGEFAHLAASGATSYSWSNAVGNATQSVSPPVNLTTHYTVTGTDANNCAASATIAIKVNPCNGIGEELSGSSIFMYPNPTSGVINFKFENLVNSAEIIVTDALGRSILNKKITSTEDKIDISASPAGVYFVQVIRDSDILYNGRIIKE
jgi:hypothetical protein